MKKLLLLITTIGVYCNVNAQTITWSQHIAPILYANCTKCHHPGGAGHFSLLTFADAHTYGFLMEQQTAAGTMPPWTPDENYKHFAHERVLPQADIDKISQWVAGGRMQGDVALAPTQPTYTNASSLGTVDLTVRIPTYTVTSNSDVYRNFPITTNIPAGRYVTAIEVIPGNTHIVHHVLVFQDSTNVPAQLDAAQTGPGYTNAGGSGSAASKLIIGWTPGSSPYYTPVSTGFRLAANTNIVVQVHYPAGSNGLTDSTRINFKLTTVPQRDITVLPVLNHLQNINASINIPANTTRTYYEQQVVPTNYTVLSAFPHMHLIGRTIKSWANKTTAPFDTVRFVNIPDWDFHWQDTYVFPNAVKVPSGYKWQAVANYDNTSSNPDNPSTPPQNVTAGESTTDEMMIVGFGVMPYQNGDEDLIIDRRVIPQGATTFCSGQSVVLKMIEGVGYTYQWLRNGNLLSNANQFSYTATLAGNYSALISLGNNSSLSDTIAVTVMASPTAVITPVGSTTVCPGNSVTLNASTGNGYSYQWFNNGTPILNATSSSYSANTSGSYMVQIYNGCYTNSSAVSVTASAPVSTITPFGSTTICQGESVTLTAPSGYTYQWSTNATSQSINVSQAGSFTVTVTDANNCTAVSSAVTTTVRTPPVASITANGATVFCPGSSVTLNASAGATYNWSNNEATQSIVVTQGGSYRVTVTDGNNCSAASLTTIITLYPAPSAIITPNGTTDLCPGGSVTLTAASNISYLWSNNFTTQSITVSQTGNYLVTVTDANNCTSVNSINVIAHSAPDATITPDRPTTICPGESVILSAPTGMSYNWSNNATTESITVSANGNFTVTVTDSYSCTAISAPVTVTVSNNAVAGITASGATTFCQGGNVDLTASSGTAYLWSNNATTQHINVTAGGSYIVTVTVSGTCTAVSTPITVIIHPLPVVTLSGNADVACDNIPAYSLIGGSPTGGTFSGTGVTGGMFDPASAGTGVHVITYSYTDNNGCINTANEDVEVTICSGIAETEKWSFTVSPNPSNGNFVIALNGWKNVIALLNIFDISGKLIYTTTIEKMKSEIALGEIPSGCYLLQLKTDKATFRRTLVFQK